jgi:hypothetical protein
MQIKLPCRNLFMTERTSVALSPLSSPRLDCHSPPLPAALVSRAAPLSCGVT